jgi:hypothetical protein
VVSASGPVARTPMDTRNAGAGRGVQVRVQKRSATWASGCGCLSIRLGASTADIYRQLLHIYMKVLLDGCKYNMTILLGLDIEPTIVFFELF